MLYPINEIFSSIQGEGTWTGTPCAFIRFAGCDLQCPWCDTDHTQRTMLDETQIMDHVWSMTNDPNHIVLTGGEPTLQNLEPLIRQIQFDLPIYNIKVETNGTKPAVIRKLKEGLLKDDWITVSPKFLNAAIKASITLADEVKLVYDPENNSPTRYDQGRPWMLEHFAKGTAFIQPMSGDIKPALDYVLSHPYWNLSVQVQKLIGVR